MKSACLGTWLARVMTMIGLVSLASWAHATIMTTGCINADQSCTLQELVDGGSMRVGDKLFDNWQVELLRFSIPPGPTFSQVDVIPLDDQPLNPGFKLIANSQLATLGQSFINLNFNFTVTVMAPCAPGGGLACINGGSLTLNRFAFGGAGGLITIDEAIFARGVFLSEHVEVDHQFGTLIVGDAAVLAPQSALFVEDDIVLRGDFPGDTVRLVMFEQRFSQVAEPTTVPLVTIGLAALGLAIRLRREVAKERAVKRA